MHSPRKRFKIATAMALAFGVAAIACAQYTLQMLEPVYRARPDPTAQAQAETDGFPHVDWSYWKQVNPDTIGWITVPGTLIDYPVLKAPKDDPDYYLHHDVHRNWSIAGAIYLDSACANRLLDSPNAVVYGHNMWAPGMFTELQNMSDRSWAAKHRTVLVQQPGRKAVMDVAAARIVNARAEGPKTAFDSRESLQAWHDDVLAQSSVRLSDSIESNTTLSLVVCSYRTFSDERTVTYCAPTSQHRGREPDLQR